MVAMGWAWAYPRYSLDYVPQETAAARNGLGGPQLGQGSRL
jgi:hypothetical protein